MEIAQWSVREMVDVADQDGKKKELFNFVQSTEQRPNR